MTTSKLQKDADRLFSLWVRQRDADNLGLAKCCTCQKILSWRNIHCGHFMSRRYNSTRYDEKNTGPQCTGCNTYNQGKQYEFSIYLDEKYGKGTSKKMLTKSKMDCKRTRVDYQYLIKDLKTKLKENNFVIR